MMLASKKASRHVPTAGRPYMSGYDMVFRQDKRPLSWTRATGRFSRAHNYYLSAVRADGRPHVMPIWGVWFDRSFYFSTARRSRKSKNLSLNPSCVVCSENAWEAVILEGVAKEVREGSLRSRFNSSLQERVRLGYGR
ncbi:pyridoxamine 5'-phosphate oxidase [Candidatus Bathyarchaeota archaeon]|nr:MAG: pyridoxamine 5'-phosphate oxidase [Candidatus Bathyarchaeota archaeon]